MELATTPQAARAPAAWHTWWLLPLGIGVASVVAVTTGPDGTRIPVGISALAATAATALCVRLLIRSQLRLRHSVADFRARQAQYSQEWQQHMITLEGQRAAERSLHESRLAEEARAWQGRLEYQQALVARLGNEFLPDALKRLRDGESIDDVLAPLAQDPDVSPEFRRELRKVLRTALIAVEEEFNRSTSAEQAVISIGSRIHVLTSKLRGRLHEMQGEHGRLPAVARGLMELDQEIGPADCLAASIGVLGGSDRPGRQWQEPQRLLSVVRGGVGRIKDFDRVQLRHLPELGVDGGLVDHLTLVFAHLLDNATRYSPPTEPVVVSGKEVPNGVGIEIQDAGKGLTEEKKRQALEALEGVAAGPGIGGLSEDANLGLRVVGKLTRKYGIRVTFADSPWLGTSVVVVVPHKYFSPLPAGPVADSPTGSVAIPAPMGEPAPNGAGPSAVPATAVATEAGTADGTRPGIETTPGGLPRRRSRRGDAANAAAPAAGPAAPVAAAPTASTSAADAAADAAAVPPDSSFSGLAAFATTAGRDTDEKSRTEESD
ncbi:sensor histidine kinase KdpD [Streptomyces sp. ISL-100]|uniref:sensor histidine kinase n=1 Tax=Streptomyces sp. ISL-100 TaxID=2819173 RepID=UPI001BE66872|nr:ATP-binding protein [Streptomyces sp. ISL-100]MBT2394444.1 ATP-binding protein [Streptomyces sp. ISL-100]